MTTLLKSHFCEIFYRTLALFVVSTAKDKDVNDKLNEAIMQYSSWFTLSSKEIDTLKADLAELQKGLNCSDAMTVLRNEITNLKNKVLCLLY